MNFFRQLFGGNPTPPAETTKPPETEEETQLEEEPSSSPSQAVADTQEILDEPETDAEADESDDVDGAESDTDDIKTDDVVGSETAPVHYVPDGATRPLPEEPSNIFQPHKGHIIFGQSSDQGMVRQNNQDSAMSFYSTSASVEDHPDFGLFMVADGMGGHHDGEKASALTAQVVASQVMNEIYLPLLNKNSSLNDADSPPISETLMLAVKYANEKVIKQVPEGGTTITAVIVVGNFAHVAHVGDSRAYFISDEGIEQITRDHSLVQRLIELGTIKEEERAGHPQGNVLYRAIGQNAEIEVDTLSRRLPSDSALLICSDGLWNAVSESEILETIRKTPDPQEACDKLIALANAHGGHDNITAVLLKMPGK